MKSLFTFVIFVFLIGNFSTITNAQVSAQLENKLDEIYSFIEKGKFTYKYGTSDGTVRDIRDTPHPYKLKYCKTKNNTFTVLSNQGCKYWDRETYKTKATTNINIIRGKKIKRSDYLSLNSDYSDETNLICIKLNQLAPKKYGYNVFFLTHTLSNKIYLNSLVQVSIRSISEYKRSGDRYEWVKKDILVGDDTKEKAKWRHQGKSIKEGNDYVLEFFKYFDNDVPWPSVGQNNYPSSIRVYSNDYHYNTISKCYANDEYWLAMYPMLKKENVVTKSDEEIRIAQERAKEKQLLEQQKEKERQQKKKEQERIKKEKEKERQKAIQIAKAEEEKRKELKAQEEESLVKQKIIEELKGTCRDIGFEDGTETMSNCVLQLMLKELDNQAKTTTVVTNNPTSTNNSSATDALARANEEQARIMEEQTRIMERQLRQQRLQNLRESQKLFQSMMDGTCSFC